MGHLEHSHARGNTQRGADGRENRDERLHDEFPSFFGDCHRVEFLSF